MPRPHSRLFRKPKPGYAIAVGNKMTQPGKTASMTHVGPVRFKHFDRVMAAFVAILLLSNIIGAAKLTAITLPFWPDGWWPAPEGTFIYGAGILFFPVSYVIGDVLTEVYGYARARRVIWTGFGALIFMAFMSWVVVRPPPAGTGRMPMNRSSGWCPESFWHPSSPSGLASSSIPSSWPR